MVFVYFQMIPADHKAPNTIPSINQKPYCIEQQTRQNTLGKNDGILQGWVDEKLVFEKNDVRMRDADTLKIETAWLNLYYGGTWTAKFDYHVYMTGLAIRRFGRMPAATRSL
ncbi:polysaccharide lyase [Novipirellula aureliae]|nr:hypothetical protein [Novipirellula aureliae]